MINKIIKTFFNKKFLTFCIIGLLAYFVHQAVYSVYLNVFHLYDDEYHLLSTAIAFTIASIFTFIANAKFTYASDIDRKKTIQSVIVFIAKFALTEGLALGIMAIAKNLWDEKETIYKLVDALLPLILTCITLVLQFLAFNVIFREKKNVEKEETTEKNNEENPNEN